MGIEFSWYWLVAAFIFGLFIGWVFGLGLSEEEDRTYPNAEEEYIEALKRRALQKGTENDTKFVEFSFTPMEIRSLKLFSENNKGNVSIRVETTSIGYIVKIARQNHEEEWKDITDYKHW